MPKPLSRAPNSDLAAAPRRRFWPALAVALAVAAATTPLAGAALAADERARVGATAESPLVWRASEEETEAEDESGLEALERFADEVIEPQMRRNIERLVEMVTPWFNRLAASLEDLPQYEPPVVLPNGDILIRRKPDTPDPPQDETERDGVVDL